MSTFKRLTKVFESSDEITFDENSKFILFSDIHRGDNSWTDDFAHNQNILFHALNYYFDAGFTYFELGDSDELWEVKKFDRIKEAHSHIFWLMDKFIAENRFQVIFGNHDKEKQNKQRYNNQNITVKEGIILSHKNIDLKIFLVHGHQGDLFGDYLWKIGRFFVRYIWRNLQLLGINDPTSPARNNKKRNKVEQKIITWVKQKNQTVIVGHTHRPAFPSESEPPYFNDGSCIHPRCITGIEIENNQISLIKWWTKSNINGILQISREILAGPRELDSL